ncbi:MAG: HAD-IA family hydrolase [Clostridia bacterium]|nr:HAD-IA family hydrolase [Clostridia bacterium]
MDERLLNAEAIVFDVGNVLLGFDTDIVVQLLPESIRHPLEEAMFGPQHLWVPFDLGMESNDVIAQRIADAAGLPKEKEHVLHLLHHFPDTMTPLPLSGMLDDLRRLGKRLYALTNYPEPSFTITTRHFPFLLTKLNGAVVSAREKMAKPDPAFFRLIRDRYQLCPEKTLFIDDLSANVNAAAQEGFRTWHYDGEDKL